MDEIRQNILHEQSIRKARLSAHFDKAFQTKDVEAKTDEDKDTDKVKQDKGLMKSIQIDSFGDAINILEGLTEI